MKCRTLIMAGLSLALLGACQTVRVPSMSSMPVGGVTDRLGPNQQAVVVVIDSSQPPEDSRSDSSGANTALRRAMRLAKQIASDYETPMIAQWPIRSLSVHCFIVASNQPEQLIRALNQDARVSYAQRFHEYEALGFTTQKRDPYTNLQHLPVAEISRTFDLGKTGHGISIAILDTSADLQHIDLRGAQIDQTDFVGDRKRRGGERHGTAVTGAIAAQTGNGIGIAGIAPRAQISVLRGCWQINDVAMTAKCNVLSLARGLDDAVRRHPDIVNLSITGPPDRLLEALIDKLVGSGTIIVAAHDPHRSPNERFPRPRPGVVYAYGASTQVQVEAGSAKDQTVTISPNDVFTLQPGNRYDVVSGHSMAASQVTGLIALIKEKQQTAGASDVLAHLRGIETYLYGLHRRFNQASREAPQ